MSGLYLPLFMFYRRIPDQFRSDGKALPARGVSALFRNALDPGQYPYPFWHDAKEMGGLSSPPTRLTLWVDPAKVRVVIMQFSARGEARTRA